MSASMSNTQPVFDLITHRTRELCGSLASMLFEFDGEQLHLRAWGGFDPDAAQDYLRQFPMRPDRGTAVGRVILERRVVHIRDVSVDPDIGQAVRTMGVRSTAGVPLLRGGQAIGVIAIGSSAIGGFTNSPDRTPTHLCRAGSHRHRLRRDLQRVEGAYRSVDPFGRGTSGAGGGAARGKLLARAGDRARHHHQPRRATFAVGRRHDLRIRHDRSGVRSPRRIRHER